MLREGPAWFVGGRRQVKIFHVGAMLALFSLLGASWAHFSRLAAFVASLGRFFRVLARSGLDFGGFRVAPGRVLKLQGLIFRRFCMHARLRGRNAQNVTKPQF